MCATPKSDHFLGIDRLSAGMAVFPAIIPAMHGEGISAVWKSSESRMSRCLLRARQSMLNLVDTLSGPGQSQALTENRHMWETEEHTAGAVRYPTTDGSLVPCYFRKTSITGTVTLGFCTGRRKVTASGSTPPKWLCHSGRFSTFTSEASLSNCA